MITFCQTYKVTELPRRRTHEEGVDPRHLPQVHLASVALDKNELINKKSTLNVSVFAVEQNNQWTLKKSRPVNIFWMPK